MKKSFIILGLLVLTVCSLDTRVSSRWRFTHNIVNNSGQDVRIVLYFTSIAITNVSTYQYTLNISSMDTLISVGDCYVQGGDMRCSSNSNFVDESGSVTPPADSVDIIFGESKIRRFYNRLIINYTVNDSCKNNILLNCTYDMQGLGTSHEIFTYTITEEDYENAKPIEN